MLVSAFAVFASRTRTLPQRGTRLGSMTAYATGYPISKIATEGAVRAAAHILDLPVTIARMNIGYGVAGHGGVPVQYFDMLRRGLSIPVLPGRETYGSPISEDDIASQGAGPIFDIASVPATVVNWAGDDVVSATELATTSVRSRASNHATRKTTWHTCSSPRTTHGGNR